MSAYIKNKSVSTLNLDKKEHLQTISFENTLNVNSPPSVNFSSKIGNNESLHDLKSEHISKTDSNCSHSSSSKAPSRSSSNSLTFSYARGLYLSVIEKYRTIEQAKLLALQAEERSKRNLKLLEKSFELEKERLLTEAAEAREKAALAELETNIMKPHLLQIPEYPQNQQNL